MKQLHLNALRDIAIEFIPAARGLHSSRRSSYDDVSIRLFTIAFLSLHKPTASALELAAAQLLQNLMSLAIPLDEKLTPRERRNFETWSIEAAHELFELTERVTPTWLPPPVTVEPEREEESQPPVAEESHATKPQLSRPAQGINLTTAQAALFLNRKPQTLRTWASKDIGPLRPIRSGGKLSWASDEVLSLMNKGW